MTGEARGSLGRRMGLATLIMTAGVMVSRLTGHAREALIVALNGAGAQTDAYYAAFTLPDLLNYMLAGGALSIAFLPIFSEHLASGREHEGWRVFSVVATTMTMVMAALVILGEVAAPALVPWLVPDFSPEQLALTVRLTRIVMPAQLAFYVGGLLQATLYAREVFWAPALSPLVYNVVTILGGLALRPLGVEGFAWGILAGAFLGPFLLPLVAARRAVRYRFRFSLTDPGLVRFVKLSLPLMLGVSLLTIDQWISRRFASGDTGGITHLDNARRIMLVPTAVLGQAAGMAALPFLARLYASGEVQRMIRVFGAALRGVLEVTVLAATWLALAAGPAVMLVFGWGRNTLADVQDTATLLVAFSLGIPAWGLQGVAVRGFYARRDTFTPMLVSSVVAALSVPVYWALFQRLGVLGLALATSLGMTGTALATLWASAVKGIPPGFAGLASSGVRSLGAAAVAGVAAWGATALVGRVWSWHDPVGALVWLGVSGGVFALVTLALAHPLGLEGVERLRAALWARVSGLGARVGRASR